MDHSEILRILTGPGCRLHITFHDGTGVVADLPEPPPFAVYGGDSTSHFDVTVVGTGAARYVRAMDVAHIERVGAV